MAPVRYSLHYEDYSEQLMARFGKLLQQQSLVDMTLMCSSHTLRVHKAVLAASSAYFQEVLQKQTGEPLIILKMRFSVLKSLVEFMYCGRTNCLEENLDELVSAAQFLQIKGLSKVTKEGLGITNHDELPAFSPPVVINRPPAVAAGGAGGGGRRVTDSPQVLSEPKQSTSQTSSTIAADAASRAAEDSESFLPTHCVRRQPQDAVVRIPFDIKTGAGAGASAQASAEMMGYAEAPRASAPRRGRPGVRRGARAGEPSWERRGEPARAAERTLLRRERDSRSAVHQLKHLQSMQMQDYMDRVTLSQAVDSICGSEATSTGQNYMNMDSDLMYMDQNVNKSNYGLEQAIAYKDSAANETITSDYMPNDTPTTTRVEHDTSGISSAMSQYVNALKNAGLPTDLPILFESGDGSYINVNEQVLLDMVQSSEIQYEVIDQPNMIENIVDPREIKSIDDLSASIERGEMLLNTKSFASTSNFGKESAGNFDTRDENLNAILPDMQETYGDQQNYAVMEQVNNTLDHENPPDFACMDGDMHFFTNKAMNDDVKKYYEEQQLDDPRVMGQICPTNDGLDTSFNMSLLETSKVNSASENMDSNYHLNTANIDLRKTDCFDFELQLPQNSVFKANNFSLNPTQLANEACQSVSVEDNVEIILPENSVNNVDLAVKTDEERYRDMINMVKSTDLNSPEPVRPTHVTNLKTENDESGAHIRIRPVNVAVVLEADTENVKDIRPVNMQIQEKFLATGDEVIAAVSNMDTSTETQLASVDAQPAIVETSMTSIEVPLTSVDASLGSVDGTLPFKEAFLTSVAPPLALVSVGATQTSLPTPLVDIQQSSVSAPQKNYEEFNLQAEVTEFEKTNENADSSLCEPDTCKGIIKGETTSAVEAIIETFDRNIVTVHFDDVNNDSEKDVNFVNIVKEITAEFNYSGVADCSMIALEPKKNIEKNTAKLEGKMCNDIPFAVGLLPLREVQNLQSPDRNNSDRLKRKASLGEVDSMDNVDAKCLKRKVKYRKL